MKEAADLLTTLASKGLTLAVAESLTGGRLADALVSIPGASRVFAGGAVCYQTQTKSTILGVNPHTINQYSVVSEEVALEMAVGAATKFGADCAISTTGVAGPKTDFDPAPVGTVCVGLYYRGSAKALRLSLDGDREGVRCGAVSSALLALYQFVNTIS